MALIVAHPMKRLRLDLILPKTTKTGRCRGVMKSCGLQVELKYPAASERPAQTARQAQPLSFRPGEAPKQAAELPQWAPDQVSPASVAASSPLLSHTPRHPILAKNRDSVLLTAD